MEGPNRLSALEVDNIGNSEFNDKCNRGDTSFIDDMEGFYAQSAGCVTLSRVWD